MRWRHIRNLITRLFCLCNRRGFDLLGIFSRDDSFSFDPIIRLGSKSQERQEIATHFISIKKLLRYFSGSFAVGGVVMFYLR